MWDSVNGNKANNNGNITIGEYTGLSQYYLKPISSGKFQVYVMKF